MERHSPVTEKPPKEDVCHRGLAGVDRSRSYSHNRHIAILPLPADVVARIKSGAAITSLSQVILELVKNALDAGATKIEAVGDLSRGGCTVEDNGSGIFPLDFSEDGGLGKMYYTSKYNADRTYLGANGTFLHSLAAVSLFTITSHHHEHRSHNSITFHRSRVIDRQIPVSTQQEINSYTQGTRVTVRNLFGNMPVRIKQRAIAFEQRSENDRVWEALKKDLTSMLLGWRRPVTLKLRDAENNAILSVSGKAAPTTDLSHNNGTMRPRSTELQVVLNLLTQASYITFEEWGSWVPISASTSSISIKGAISLDPAPSKRVQFISLGLRALSSDAGHNELYDQVNRVFSMSSFGIIEDASDIDGAEKVRRTSDRRYKNDGYTNRQLKGRKGIDRWPMFFLHISLKPQSQATSSEKRFFDNEQNLLSIIEVLDAMLTRWLSVHHFRPQKSRLKRARVTSPSSSTSRSDHGSIQPLQTRPTSDLSVADTFIQDTSTQRQEYTGSRKRKGSVPSSKRALKRTKSSAFAEWSRIKSGKPGFYDSLSKPTSVAHVSKSLRKPSTPGNTSPNVQESSKAASILVDATALDDAPYEAHNCGENDLTTDEVTTWTNPMTKQAYLVNSRTGCVMLRVPTRPQSESSIPKAVNTLVHFNKTLRLQQRPKSSGDYATEISWLDRFLQEWDNPVFKPVEARIQQLSLSEPQIESQQARRSRHFGCSQIDIERTFTEASISNNSKLSKAGLGKALVLAQIDKKFILAKVCNSSTKSDVREGSELLVLIDQHAADERIRVEALLSELCTPVLDSSPTIRFCSNLGHVSQIAFTILDKPIQFSVSMPENDLLRAHAAHFAAWGILYDIELPKAASLDAERDKKQQRVISVTTLPPIVSERCKADPKILISLLRSEIWRCADAHHLPLVPARTSHPSEADDVAFNSWPHYLHSCPQPLIDLVNSRACRSAIMFNDELNMRECVDLVRKLSECIFPFMCAHGRPSMVPLVDLGLNGIGESLGLEGRFRGKDTGKKNVTESGFVASWRRWRQEVEAQESKDDL